jgi:hypothetical protein
MRPRVRALLLLAALGGALWGCGPDLSYDQQLEDRLGELAAAGGSERLDRLTAADWDTVYVFSGTWGGEEMNAIVGAHVLADRNFIEHGTWLFVFVEGGRVVRGSYVGYMAKLHIDPGTYQKWGRDVRVEPDPSMPGWLRFTSDSTTPSPSPSQ